MSVGEESCILQKIPPAFACSAYSCGMLGGKAEKSRANRKRRVPNIRLTDMARGKGAGGNARKKGSGGGERALPVLRTGGAVATGEIPRTKAPRKRHPIPSKSGKAYRGTVRIPPGATGGTQKGEATRGTMREDRGNPCDMTGNRSFSVWRGKNAPRVRRANRGGAFFVIFVILTVPCCVK